MSATNKTGTDQSSATEMPFKASQNALSIGQDLQVISATDEVFNHVDENEPMWSGDGDRHVDVPVVFEEPFKSAPSIQAGLSGVDCDHEVNLRFNIECRDVTETGFTLRFLTWGNTRIARACVSWSAVGAAKVATTGTTDPRTQTVSKATGPSSVRPSATKPNPVR